jgi:putative transposase
MDWRGRYLDNVIRDRLWRSMTPEAIYMHEITNGFQVERSIGN